MSKHHYGGYAGKQGTLDMQRKIAHLGRVIHDKQRDAEKRNEQIRQLKTENAKLRELVRDMWFWSYKGYMDSESQEWQMKHIGGVFDRMCELGAEVDDA